MKKQKFRELRARSIRLVPAPLRRHLATIWSPIGVRLHPILQFVLKHLARAWDGVARTISYPFRKGIRAGGLWGLGAGLATATMWIIVMVNGPFQAAVTIDDHNQLNWGQSYGCNVVSRGNVFVDNRANALRTVTLNCPDHPMPQGRVFEATMTIADSQRTVVPAWHNTADGSFFVQNQIQADGFVVAEPARVTAYHEMVMTGIVFGAILIACFIWWAGYAFACVYVNARQEEVCSRPAPANLRVAA